MKRCLLALLAIGSPAPAFGAETPIRVTTGLMAVTADMKVEVLDGLALVADERWEIVANCPDRTGPSIAFARGSGAIDVDLTVEIVEGLDAISADRQVCVTNPANLDDKTAELLKLKRETGLGDESPVSAPSDF